MTKPIDIITDALEKLNSYAPGETISGEDSSRGFQLLADMVNQWVDDYIQLFQIINLNVTLLAGLQMYTIGAGGSVASPRPPRILQGPAYGSITIGAVTTPCDTVSAIEWNAIYNPILAGMPPSGTPVAAFYDPQFPLGLLWFSPTPDVAGTASIPAVYGLTGFPASLTLPDVVMAPGQSLSLASNLALLLHSYFQVGQLTPDLVVEAQQSKTALAFTNKVSRAMIGRGMVPQSPIVPRT